MEKPIARGGILMKRVLSFLLSMLLLISAVPALAETEGQIRFDEDGNLLYYRAVVANPNVADRLNLREEPSASSKSLGRIYSGTPVDVYDVVTCKDGQEWAYVDLHGGYEAGGSLIGYMLNEYLMPMNRNVDAPQLFHTARPISSRVLFRAEPKYTADTDGYLSSEVYVLGDIGDDWRLVMNKDEGVGGFVRTVELKDHRISIDLAFLVPQSGREAVPIYADKDLKKEIGFIFSGACVRVNDFSRNGGWAAVQCYGAFPDLYWEDEETKAEPFLAGYVRLTDLKVFVQPWQVKSGMRAAASYSEIRLTEPDEAVIPKGAAFVVVGEADRKYFVLYPLMNSDTYAAGFVYKWNINLLHNRYADTSGAERIGLVSLKKALCDNDGVEIYSWPGQEKGERTWNTLAELLSEIEYEGETWLQLRCREQSSFFVRKADAETILLNDDIFSEYHLFRDENRDWTVEQTEQGMYVLTVEPGQSVKLTLTFKDGGLPQEYDVQAQDSPISYTVYLPAGTQVHLDGNARLRTATKGNYPVPVSKTPPAYMDDSVVFEGTGRFYSDSQLADFSSTYFSYSIQPIPGAEDCWAAVTDIFTRQDGDGNVISGKKWTLRFDEPETADSLNESDESPYVYTEWNGGMFIGLELHPGDFLEVHNCRVLVAFGNG